MNLVHGIGNASYVAPKSLRKTRVCHVSSKDFRGNEIPASVATVTGTDRQMDATRDYTHAYREQGRFGSHPSHDSFDDESEP